LLAEIADVVHSSLSGGDTVVVITDLYKYSPDVVPPIHTVSYHVATDKPPA